MAVMGGNGLVEGTAGDDVLYGFETDDTLMGMGGDDLLEGGAGADELHGGSHGMYGDTASYMHSAEAVHVELSALPERTDEDLRDPIHGGDAEGDKLIGIENVYGSMQGDFLSGDGSKNLLAGFDGDDWIHGQGGADTLVGGMGADTLSRRQQSRFRARGRRRRRWCMAIAAATRCSATRAMTRSKAASDDDVLVGGDGQRRAVRGRGWAPHSTATATTSCGPVLATICLYGTGGDDTLLGGMGADELNGGEDVNDPDNEDQDVAWYLDSAEAVEVHLGDRHQGKGRGRRGRHA